MEEMLLNICLFLLVTEYTEKNTAREQAQSTCIGFLLYNYLVHYFKIRKNRKSEFVPEL